MAQVVWSERARGQFELIVRDIARDRPTAAAVWAERLASAPDTLDRFPDIGSPVEDAGVDGLRELIVGPYRMVYAHRNDVCRILIVFHGRRDIRRVLTADDLREPDA